MGVLIPTIPFKPSLIMSTSQSPLSVFDSFNQSCGQMLDRYCPSDFNRGPAWLTLVGVVSMFLLVFSKLSFYGDVARISGGLTLISFLVVFVIRFRLLVKEKIVQLFLLSIIFPLVFFLINYLNNPIQAKDFFGVDRLAKLFSFMPLAWWLGGKVKNYLYLLATAAAGVFIGLFFTENFGSEIQRLISGKRVDFNTKDAQYLALYFSFILIFITSQLRKILTCHLSIKLFSFVVFIIGIAMVYGSQTRSAFLALPIVLTCQLFLIFRQQLAGKRMRAIGGVLVVFTLLVAISFPVVKERVFKESKTISHLLKHGMEGLPYSSAGVRLHLWHTGLNWIKEKPFIGWGGEARLTAIKTAEHWPDKLRGRWGHFHNTYIEFWVAYGVFGLAVLLAFFAYLMKQALSFGIVDGFNLAHFIGLSSLLLFIMQFFESYLYFSEGVYVVMVIFSGVYTLVLKTYFTPASLISSSNEMAKIHSHNSTQFKYDVK